MQPRPLSKREVDEMAAKVTGTARTITHFPLLSFFALALMVIATLLVCVGGVVLINDVVGFFVGLARMKKIAGARELGFNETVFALLMSLVQGFGLIAGGIALAFVGEVTRVFLGVERNTRATNEMLERMQGDHGARLQGGGGATSS